MKHIISAVIGIILIISGVCAHATRAGVKEAVHTGFAAAQGHKPAPQDIFARFMTGTFAALSAESVGKIYAAGGVDPIIHKLLHGGIGAASGFVLQGKDGAISGASAAVLAETLGDLIRPQVEAALTEIARSSDSHDDYRTQAEEYLNTQHNLLLLTSVSITASLGGDVDMATYAADNALSNNYQKALGVLLKLVWQTTKNIVTKGAVKSVAKPVNVEKLADKVAKKLGGVKTPAKGDGYKILIPNKKNDIVVRVMDKGGRRSAPYYRVSIKDKGTVNKLGELCNERGLTHFEITPESLTNILSIVGKIKG